MRKRGSTCRIKEQAERGRARLRGCGAGPVGPASARAGVWGRAPHKNRVSMRCVNAVQLVELRSRRSADAPACEGAARGRWAPLAPEPGCGAEPHIRTEYR